MPLETHRERRLVVLLHADIVGSTALVHRNETIAHARITSAFREFSRNITEYGGTVHEVRGDALVAEFARASDAVAGALAAQASNTKLSATLPDDIQPRMRVGIALGEVIVADDTVTGPGIVLAQRLEQLAEPGGVCIQGSVYEAVPRRMPYAYANLGECEVKGFEQPVRAFAVTVEHDEVVPVPEPPVASAGAAPAHRQTIHDLAATLGGWFKRSPKADESGTPDTPLLSITVLPFTTVMGDPNQDYFADALTEDLTADLSRITGSFVISRSTAATYRGQNLDVRVVASELGVRHVLQGSVRRAANDVRVNVELVDGETGRQVWSERYDKAAGDMYTFQNEVTSRIARALNLELKDAVSRQVARQRPGNLDSQDLTLRAWAELWTKPQSPATNAESLGYIAQALTIDPDNAEALGVAAYAYARAAVYGWGENSRADAIRDGIAAGEQSLALDPKNADAVYALGFVYFAAGETTRAREFMLQCIALNRNHAPGYFFFAVILMRLGYPTEAIESIERAFALSPRDPLRSVWYGVLARAQITLNEDALAIETAHKGLAANPNHAHNYEVLASALAHLDRIDEAHAALEEWEQRQPGITISRYQKDVVGNDPKALNTYARLISGLRKAGLPD